MARTRKTKRMMGGRKKDKFKEPEDESYSKRYCDLVLHCRKTIVQDIIFHTKKSRTFSFTKQKLESKTTKSLPWIPNEIWIIIFSFIPDIISLSVVNRRFNQLFEERKKTFIPQIHLHLQDALKTRTFAKRGWNTDYFLQPLTMLEPFQQSCIREAFHQLRNCCWIITDDDCEREPDIYPQLKVGCKDECEHLFYESHQKFFQERYGHYDLNNEEEKLQYEFRKKRHFDPPEYPSPTILFSLEDVVLKQEEKIEKKVEKKVMIQSYCTSRIYKSNIPYSIEDVDKVIFIKKHQRLFEEHIHFLKKGVCVCKLKDGKYLRMVYDVFTGYFDYNIVAAYVCDNLADLMCMKENYPFVNNYVR